MKKIFTLLAVAAMAFCASAQEKEWNVSNWAAATYTTETTLDGFTIHAATGVDESGATKEYTVVIDSSKKKVDGVQYTLRLKTGGGAGKTTDGTLYRALSFDVPSAGTISFLATSSNSSDNRVCGVSYGEYIAFPVAGEDGVTPEMPQGLNAVDVAAGNPVFYSVNYTGDAATKVYIFSKSGGINFYDFKFTPGQGGSSGLAAIAADAEAPAVYYNLQGIEVANPTSGLYICKQGNKVSKVIL